MGCGTGKNTIFLLKTAKKIIGLDFSQEMLNKAKVKVIDGRVEFRKSDLNKNWCVEDNLADLITCSLTLEHIKNLNFIFNEASRKLKPQGYFFICELHPFKQYTGSKARYESESKIVELETYTHHISDYISAAKANGFELKEVDEWFDDANKTEIPRLISFVFFNNSNCL
ncbi:MAG: class I SAM-dependent methyltransferase [Flavobacteriaceae bacterium]|nr:class I SAM-dependent methyltransferase [Flavobacteriaceae bacterium]